MLILLTCASLSYQVKGWQITCLAVSDLKVVCFCILARRPRHRILLDQYFLLLAQIFFSGTSSYCCICINEQNLAGQIIYEFFLPYT